MVLASAVLTLFDKGLLAIGNISFLSGLAFVIGLERTFRVFFQWHKAKGSIAFFGGIIVVLLGYPLIRMLVGTYGFVGLVSLGSSVDFFLWQSASCDGTSHWNASQLADLMAGEEHYEE